MAYQLPLPSKWEGMHDVFHVSLLKWYISDPSHVMDYAPLQLESNLTYIEEPVQILDRKEQELQTKRIPIVNVLWRTHNIEEASWELESEIQEK